ncbi:MAG TPA: VWA domain-containing protein [bacterium]|nr:VWA domain-containing protein [bacterium]
MDFHGVHFGNPQWLLGLLVLPPAAFAIFFLSRAKHSTFFLGNPRLVEMAPGPFSAQAIPSLLRFLALILCLVAAARPQAGQKKVEEKKPVTDLLVALDVSFSMITDDLKPNRITAAKKILGEFLDKVQNVRVGLNIFAGASFTQCPLTSDIEIVKKLLSNVDLTSVKVNGTAIGDALVSSLNRLQNGSGKSKGPGEKKPSLTSKLFGGSDAEEEKPNSQAIILLTDGGNNAGHINPLAAAKIAVTQGVKVYTIGVGGKRPVPALAQYSDGHIGPYVDPRTGQVAMEEPADMGLLNEIARITGGRSYAATDNRSLEEILTEIAKLEKREISVTTHWEYNELASFFLLAAFLILMLDIGLETTVLRTLP